MSKACKLSVISAASGAGKTTVVNLLLQNHSDFVRTVSHTTRQMRDGERNHIDYHFVSEPEFKRMIEAGEFVEWAKVYDHYYGTSKRSIESIIAQGQHAILVIEWQGAKNIKVLYPEAQFILLLPPSIEVLEKRISSRGGDAEDIKKRMHLAEHELKQMLWYDHVIMNDDIGACVRDLNTVLKDRRSFRLDEKRQILDAFLSKN